MENELIRYKNVTATTLLLGGYTILPFAEVTVFGQALEELEPYVTSNTLHKYVDGERVLPTYLELDGYGTASNNISLDQLAVVKNSLAPFGTGQVTNAGAITLKSGPGFIKSFTVIAKGTSPTLSLYNNTTGTGEILIPALNGTTPVGDFPALNMGETYVWSEPLYFGVGLHVIIGGTGTTTIQFQYK